eukprot:gene7838-12312_t
MSCCGSKAPDSIQEEKERISLISDNPKYTNSDFHFKGIVIGNSSVGKTSMVHKFTEGIFSTNVEASIGVDFKVKYLPIDEKIIKFEIWDTAGQERFRSLTASYYRKIDFAILVYDVTNLFSFESLKNWNNDLDTYAPKGILKVIVGTKNDSGYNNISEQNLKKFSDSIKAKSFLVSAKTNDFQDIFESIGTSLMNSVNQK